MSAQAHGDPAAPICLIGEAPGIEEIRRDEPFVGPAGMVLDRCLMTAGIDRQNVYIINTFPGMVKKDKKSGAVVGAGGILWKPLTGMTEAGREAARPLMDRLEAARPRVVVPLGGVALSALHPKTNGQIGKWRGSILRAPGGNAWSVATYHPATVCWGSTHLQHVIATDLQRVRRIAEQGHNPRPRNLILNPSYRDALAFVNELRAARKRVNFDLELFGRQLSAISLCNSPGESICIPFIDRVREHRWQPPHELEILSAIFGLLHDPEVPKCNQNIAFDYHILASLYGVQVRGQLDDPMVLHSIVFPDLEKSLAFQTSWLTDVPYYKDDGGKRAWENPWQNIEAFWRYSALDSAVSLECFQRLEEDYLPHSLWAETYRETVELVEPIIAMMLTGFRVNRADLIKRRAEVKAKIEAVMADLHEVHPGFNPASPKQCAELFYGKLKHAAFLGKTGAVTTDVYALKRLSRKGVAEAKQVLELRKLTKRAEFLDSVSGDRVFTAYNIRGAKTGRLSSEGSETETSSRNLQNINGEVRELMCSDDDDHVMVEYDCAGAEWFIVGYLSGEPDMITAHRESLDPHSLTASRMFDCTYEQAKADSEDPEGLRQRGKRCNHSLNYGLGAREFGLRYEMAEREAKELRDRYHRAYPCIQKVFWAGVQSDLLQTGRLVNCFGRVREFLSEPDPGVWLDAYAHIPQSTVFDLTRLAMMHVYHEEPDAQLRSQDHDAITIHCEANPRLIAELTGRIVQVLRTPLTYGGATFQLGVDAKVGYTRGKKTMIKVSSDPSQCAEALARLKRVVNA